MMIASETPVAGSALSSLDARLSKRCRACAANASRAEALVLVLHAQLASNERGEQLCGGSAPKLAAQEREGAAGQTPHLYY